MIEQFILTSVKCDVSIENASAVYVLTYELNKPDKKHELNFTVETNRILTVGTFQELTDLYK